MTIEAGKFYRRRDGRRIYVSATNKPDNMPVVGWDDHGRLYEFYPDGRFDIEEHSADLISEWRDELVIPWEHFPAWCKWWAKDADGSERGYSVKPYSEAGYWYAGLGEQEFGFARLPNSLRSNYTGDWRESLTERRGV